MNTYQQRWIEVLTNAHISGWKIEARGDDVFVEMPNVTDLKIIRDNVPATLAAMSLDIEEHKQRVKFIFHNGYENFEYVINPDSRELNQE